MKKKFAIINLSLMLTVLFSILFQSVHSYEHILHHETTFVHSDDDKSTRVQALDHYHEKCFVCEFTLSNFIPTEFTSFTALPASKTYSEVNFPASQTATTFSGSLLAYRGPPSIC